MVAKGQHSFRVPARQFLTVKKKIVQSPHFFAHRRFVHRALINLRALDALFGRINLLLVYPQAMVR